MSLTRTTLDEIKGWFLKWHNALHHTPPHGTAQVGTSAPTHAGKEGSLFYDKIARVLYVSDGGTAWTAI